VSIGGKLVWTGVALGGLALIAPGLQRVDVPKAVAEPAPTAPPAPKAQLGNGFFAQELVRQPDGHFYAEAQVNGAPVRFLIDTGASFVALTREDAQRAGIQFGDARAMVNGVGGPIEVTPVTIDRIAIGALTATKVEAAVADDLGISLLGQSFLSQVGTVEIHGDRMVLR
jgi:aspartyl protease family protein